MNGLIEEVNNIREEVEEVKERSIAWELLKDQKSQNKRLFILNIILIMCWLLTIGGFIYYINTTSFEQTIETAETTDSGNACVGDNCNNGEINYGKGN